MDVSIIIPAYNRLWSLPKAIESCRQTALAVEVIVIDDGSTDGTWEWLIKQPGIITIRQENQGKDWAVNAGFAMAKAKYVRFLDSDDWVLPFSTDHLFARAEAEQLDIVCAGYEVYNETEQFVKKVEWTICDDFLAQQLGECDSSHYSAYLFKKEFIKDIPHRQEFGGVDDRQFIIETAMKLPKTGYIELPALAHRMHNKARLQRIGGLQKAAYHLAYYNIFNKALSALEIRGELTQRRKNAVCNNLWHLAHWMADSDLQEAHSVYRWVYQLNPGFTPETNKGLAGMYKNLGFVTTERLLKLKRNIGI
ncbi:hypothetical protein A0256_10500 [Mucilaginibacter sp. PAMC 26640]|nr:hypothetical protein A0256_10500 [Mucilaginibacter sp. PAMC 26640]